METKICSKCGEEKNIIDFPKKGRQCTSCLSIKEKIYRKAHKEKIKARKKKYYEEHKEHHLAWCKKYREEHREERKEYADEYAKLYYKKHEKKFKEKNVQRKNERDIKKLGNKVLKKCSVCGKEKHYSLFPYNKACCKDCTNKKQRETRAKNNEGAKAAYKKYYANNREKLLAAQHIKTTSQEYRDKRNKKRKDNEEWRLKVNEQAYKWRKRNPGKVKKTTKRTYDKNKDQYNLRRKEALKNLTDQIVKSILQSQGFTEITPELIKTKRVLIKLHREIKNQTK